MSGIMSAIVAAVRSYKKMADSQNGSKVQESCKAWNTDGTSKRHIFKEAGNLGWLGFEPPSFEPVQT